MKIGILTAGGLAPCLSSAIGFLIQRYVEVDPKCEIILYKNGYLGLLLGKSIVLDDKMKANAHLLTKFGGSVCGNSRVKFTNVKDCVARGLVKPGEIPLEVAAKQLSSDGVQILHTIGGDDTNTAAADLVKYLAVNKHDLICVGLPKTVDNDVFPIEHTLGASTAAEQGAIFFENIVNETTTNPRMLIIHEVMGRSCGYLTAATAQEYMNRLKLKEFLPAPLQAADSYAVHAIYIPETPIDFKAEAERLTAVMDKFDCVNIFLSEGAGVDSIVQDMQKNGLEVPRDAFGHVKLDLINPGQYFAKQFAQMVGAQKVLVQKSGYFARSAAPNQFDLDLIKRMVDLAVHSAVNEKISGVIGQDNNHNNELRCIEFEFIKGGKPFNVNLEWYQQLQQKISKL